MRRYILSFSAVTLLGWTLFSHTAVAMRIRTERNAIATGRDGSKLIEIRAFGPEGGGSLAYAFEGGPKASAEEYVLSSNFSPGGSSRPQRISRAACVASLESLGRELASRGYPNVSVDPTRCKDNERSNLVTVKP